MSERFNDEFYNLYLKGIKEIFQEFKEKGVWKWDNYPGEIIRPFLNLNGGFFECLGSGEGTLSDSSIVSGHFKILVLTPDIYYEGLKKDLGDFLKDFKGSLDDEVRNSFVVEVKKGKVVYDNGIEEVTRRASEEIESYDLELYD